MCFASQRRALFRHLNLQKWSENGVCVFVHFDFEAEVFCTFWLRSWGVLYILTSKCALRDNGVHFSHIATLKSALKLWCFVHFDFEMCFAPQRRAPWKCASRHNGVQFFISHLARWLRTRCFSEPTFRPSGATNYWKNSVSQLVYLFAHLHLLSSDSFSLIFSLLLFSSLWLFPSLLFICPYCRKFDV